jgi:hypothetical protein
MHLAWTRSMCRRSWAELRFQSAWLAYQVASVIRFCWLCWRYSGDNLAGVLSALASSTCAGMATVLHRWIAEDIRNQGVDELGVHAFDAAVLAINAVVFAGTTHLYFNSIISLIDACKALRSLFIVNISSSATAIYSAGGVIRRVKRTEDIFWLSWINMCIGIVWCAGLMGCEMAVGLDNLSLLEMVMCMAFMAGRQPIEEPYQAFAFVALWIGERQARSML